MRQLISLILLHIINGLLHEFGELVLAAWQLIFGEKVANIPGRLPSLPEYELLKP